MDLGLKGRRALVLGGNRGMGLAIADALAREGADVAIAARDTERLARAAEGLGAHGTGSVAHSRSISASRRRCRRSRPT